MPDVGQTKKPPSALFLQETTLKSEIKKDQRIITLKSEIKTAFVKPKDPTDHQATTGQCDWNLLQSIEECKNKKYIMAPIK